LKAEAFARSKGIFVDTYKGNLTTIVKRFNSKGNEEDPSDDNKLIQSQNDILQLLVERDEQGRTPMDLACFLGFKNIALYLITKMGNPQVVIKQEINIDNLGRNAYHNLCFKGNFDCMIALLNIERVYLKKILFDQLLGEKNTYRFKNMDIKHGHLSKNIFHDAETVKRHEDFNIRVYNLFEQYAKDIYDRYQ
jgi:ankyrin repeat protein